MRPRRWLPTLLLLAACTATPPRVEPTATSHFVVVIAKAEPPIPTFAPTATTGAVPTATTLQPTDTAKPPAPTSRPPTSTPAQTPRSQAVSPEQVLIDFPLPPATTECARPPDDYRRVNLGGKLINARTWWMLKRTEQQYRGEGDVLRLTQGSYSTNVALSFGTHAGGGVVDIAITSKRDGARVIAREDMDAMVMALRKAGFAAYLRLPQDLTPSTLTHIHAVAIGDRELSPEASKQITGEFGYLAGWDAVPKEYGGPKRDRYGGPIKCAWMSV